MTENEEFEIREMLKDDPESLAAFEQVLHTMASIKTLPIVAQLRARRAANLVAANMLKSLREIRDNENKRN